MLRKDEIANANSCLNNAADDEPIFVLKSTDELAPATVRQWAVWYKNTKLDAGEFTPAREAKYREALQLAAQMEEWREAELFVAYEAGDEWQTTEEDWRCRDCGAVGPAEAKVQGEIQGEGAMTGLVYIDTGDYRCADCGSENVTEMRENSDA